MNITFERRAWDVRAGQTVICAGAPALVWQVFHDLNGVVYLTFCSVNASNVIQMLCKPDDIVTIAPLARVT